MFTLALILIAKDLERNMFRLHNRYNQFYFKKKVAKKHCHVRDQHVHISLSFQSQEIWRGAFLD